MKDIKKDKSINGFKFPIMMPVAAFCLFCADDLFNSGFISDTTIGLTLGMIAGIMYSWLHNNFNL